MGRLLISNLIFCDTYTEAKVISKAYGNFKIHWIELGESKTLTARRFIRKYKDRYIVRIRFDFQYKGNFETYGFIDERVKQKYPEIVDDIQNADNPWEVINKYEDKPGIYDVYYYRDFKEFLNERLMKYFQKLNMLGQIAFAEKYDTNAFEIDFDTYEGSFIYPIYLNTSALWIDYSTKSLIDNSTPIPAREIWKWMNENYYCKKEDAYSRGSWSYAEVRVITSYSYVLNRTPFEILLYAIIGLESALTEEDEKLPNGRKHGIKAQLKEIMPKLFSFITCEDVEAMYRLRSEFVHGDISFPNYYALDPYRYGHGEYKYEGSAGKARLALLMTIRLLVKNNATKIRIKDGEICFTREKSLADFAKEHPEP